MPRNATAFEVTGYQDPRSGEAGAIWRREWGGKTYITFACPCGCGAHGGIKTGPDGWTVTGEWPRISATPSIGFLKSQSTGQYHWHGFFRDGVFEEC